jgi:hypothetical protein
MLVAMVVLLRGATAAQSLRELSRDVVSDSETESTAAIAALREAGPAGLQALFETHVALIQRKRLNPAFDNAEWKRVSAALDAVARQWDSWASGLYWYTDFERAKAEARASGKPILSLRLLGDLGEEFSCANSRFFRTVLYPNAEVARFLGDHFILHWKSVRPAPRVTIDFGDGRVLERTITGNSIHYVLDGDGRVVDALPGLYGPSAFLAELQIAERAAVASEKLDATARDKFLGDYHGQRIAEIDRACRSDADKVGTAAASPSQWSDDVWTKVAALHADNASLDTATVALMRAKLPDAQDAMRLAVSKRIVETPLMREVRALERSVAEDTVRNEYVLHRTVHDWLASNEATGGVEAFNERVYAKLFLSPLSDPWLGLAPQDAYSALAHGGLKFVDK